MYLFGFKRYFVTILVLSTIVCSHGFAEEQLPQANLGKMRLFVSDFHNRFTDYLPNIPPAASFSFDPNDPEVDEIFNRLSTFLFGDKTVVLLVSDKTTIFAQTRSYLSRVFVHKDAFQTLKDRVGGERAKKFMLFTLAHELSHWIFDNNYDQDILLMFDEKTQSSIKAFQTLKVKTLEVEKAQGADESKVMLIWNEFAKKHIEEFALEHSLVDVLALAILSELGENFDGLQNAWAEKQAVIAQLQPELYEKHRQQSFVDADQQFRLKVLKYYQAK